ncbi:MAG: selenocysteine lyase/cysteine desulfurase [Gammaproteobacteria bacterium]
MFWTTEEISMPVIESQRAAFAIPADVAYFNCAYMSPLANRVVAVGERAVGAKARPWEITPEDFFGDVETARRRFAALIGADPECVAIAPSASYGLSTAAHNLPVSRGQRIVVLAEQFPSNVYPWRELAARAGATLDVVPRPDVGQWTDAVIERIGPQVAVVALAHCHWTDGRMVDLQAVGERCRDTGTALVLDLTQSLGAMPFDCARVQPDFAACASYKWLLGPYSLGFTYVAPHWHDGAPLEHSWLGREGAEDFARLVDYRDGFASGARRYDVGERSNFALLPMLNESLAMLLDWGVDNIAQTLAARTDAIARAAQALGAGALARPVRAPHFLGLTLPQALDSTQIDAVARALARDGVFVSVRGRSLRVTPHLYNSDEDVDRLMHSLARALPRT